MISDLTGVESAAESVSAYHPNAPLDALLPIRPDYVADLLRKASESLDCGDMALAKQIMEWLIGEFEIDAGIIGWRVARREHGSHYINQ